MTKSNEPFVWMPFGAGGMVAALVTPALILATGVLLPLGLLDLSYDHIRALAAGWIGKLIILTLVALPAWHAAHRIQATAHDLGWGGGLGLKRVCYGTATFVAAVSLIALLKL
ncbi:fumarate reductase subunit FrdD [Magnetospirillum fulvum]|uniref:Succinate dehydrogenase subunit D n=1 Tax=Magnetospirillum fulvum TaxID=1082 RepID=A0A1H6GSP4_MAGFU|nr:fumarate reductase subunit FrdD [Magnetospirillum fulvum]SEH25190.1 succinate dehydrogenase subunit D [Magnetospirillum fulvum]